MVWGHLVNRSALKLSVFGCSVFGLSLCLSVLSPSPPSPAHLPPHGCTLCCHDFFLNESVKQSVTFRYDILCPVCLVIYVMLPLPLPNVRSIYHVLALAFVCYLLTFRIYSALLGGDCVYIKISKYNSQQTRTPDCCIINVNATALG